MTNHPCTFLKFFKLHAWLSLGGTDVITPKLGPFDPRTDEERTEVQKKKVCVNCGEEVYEPYDWDGFC